MIEEPRITQLEATPTAFIRLTIPRNQMPEVFGPAVGELVSAVTRQGIRMTGAVFAHHLVMDPRTFDFELGVPVSSRISPERRVEAGHRPATRVAQTVHHGPYEELPEAWSRFHEWVKASGHDWASDIWECYLVHPDFDPDPTNWRTQLNRPILT